MRKVVICSGGTGGHMFPACALFQAMQKKKYNVTVLTDTRGSIFCDDISKKVIIKTIRLTDGWKTISSFLSVFPKIIKFFLEKRPDIIIGFGGIFTIMPLIIAKILGVKVAVYEQNSVAGKANKFIAKFADVKLSSFDLGKGWKEVRSPVRKEFLQSQPYKCEGKIRILVIGGSQGAASFYKIIPKALKFLSESERQNLEIVQQVSYGNLEELSLTYNKLQVKADLRRFLHNIAEIMNNSELIICRSGASTLSELAATGRPAILIPYPKSADNHQLSNALYYENKKAAWVLEENGEISENLGKIIREVLLDRKLLKNAAFHMKNLATSQTVENFIELIETV
ncbi:MAG: UDP-N-acetylglucosamine--N-acetylmuramyl-(pentapeptide) pyrophosphoryl-undecaprenol N-acetylglucosamine transferase [Holosporaceae bacterium]|nr:UDP-N-acetylglucosamine--N-acetylmuramyl-(pentapeptide) pyrophosphoryl-undecaprenol N-acetylglucosamine transferase [Holosporaceae bacterium]